MAPSLPLLHIGKAAIATKTPASSRPRPAVMARSRPDRGTDGRTMGVTAPYAARCLPSSSVVVLQFGDPGALVVGMEVPVGLVGQVVDAQRRAPVRVVPVAHAHVRHE